ncbi:hypothetical protein CCACVL1_14635 [Corchorus capsularis]|uniref:Beta-1,3-N-Acetylglucosaminyltransferase family protein n=1 Tax=Corchorus capsularis TaxID=210143 RepID=A0A1R3I6H5_COCAP|nr:hypothetical protein CCACVL1_14635 [Corchorus capsularis]
MATILNVLFALLFLSLAAQGYGQCSTSQISVSQSQTGATVGNKPEFQVTITNGCTCSQSDVKLGCNGFQTVESIPSSVLSVSGGECLVNDGQPLGPGVTISFKYAWDNSFSFSPISSEINCS